MPSSYEPSRKRTGKADAGGGEKGYNQAQSGPGSQAPDAPPPPAEDMKTRRGASKFQGK